MLQPMPGSSCGGRIHEATSGLPAPDQEGVLLSTPTFSLMNSGNRTLRAPKRSWKVNFDVEHSKDRLVDMSRLNLKAMFNDPSQMREALAWNLFAAAGVPASRHTYAEFMINDRYMGLFFFVEQVDGKFLRDRFGSNDKGNLYKAYCGDVGCATLERRVGADGDDGGREYFTGSPDKRSYRLKSQRGRRAGQHLRRPRAPRQDDRRRWSSRWGRPVCHGCFPRVRGGDPEHAGVSQVGGREPIGRQLG